MVEPQMDEAGEDAEGRVRLPPPSDEPAQLVESSDALRGVCQRIAHSRFLALDTEANSMHAYRERTCIVQLTAGDTSAIVDALAVTDLAPLREVVEADGVETIFHGGDYDITVLTRDHGFRFTLVFDTMIAATLLGEPKVGLADLVREYYGDRLDKRFQRIDWARRPLRADQLDYLQRDTIYLPGLRDHLVGRLEDADLLEEARIEFARLARRRGKPAIFDADGWRRIKGAARLDEKGRAVLSALFLWREDEARRRDVPPFKVLAPRTLVDIAAQPPAAARRADDLRQLGDRDRRRHGRAVLKAVREGLGAAERGAGPPARTTPRLTQDAARVARTERERVDRLKDWRRREATRRSVPNVVVLPNPAVEWLAREVPQGVQALDACEDLGAKRIARYGKRILELLGARPGRTRRHNRD